jgi:hypothetical protein
MMPQAAGTKAAGGVPEDSDGDVWHGHAKV